MARHLSNVGTNVLVEEQVKPFTAIPGPPRIPILGTLLPYKVGMYNFFQLEENLLLIILIM